MAIERTDEEVQPMEVDETSPIPGTSQDNATESENYECEEPGGTYVGDIYIPPSVRKTVALDEQGARLVITHIVNKNFKSYAGVEVLGPFHKSFTAVIGPNGSGKSNVIDSMLFVFGYRASKLRSKKLSVMIHSSARHSSNTEASVAVYFQKIIESGPEDFTAVPDSSFSISRTVYKDNSTKYFLNNQLVQFNIVKNKLLSFGIDLDHNRFLILQGEVEQIALMKSKGQSPSEVGMLEYLEDIIGTARYKEPLDKLYEKVEEKSGERKEKLNRVRMVEQEKSTLEGPMQEAVELIILTNIMLRTKNKLLQKTIHKTQKASQAASDKFNDKKQKVQDIDKELNELKNKIQENSSTLEVEMRKYSGLQRKKEEIVEKMQELKRVMVSLQADNAHDIKKRKAAEQSLAQEKAKLIEIEIIPQKNAQMIEECSGLLARHQQAKETTEAELQKVMNNLRATTQGLQAQKDALQERLIELNRVVDESTKTFKLAESELKLYLATEIKENEKMTKLRSSCDKVVNDIQQKESEKERLNAHLPNDEQELNEARSRFDELKQEERTLLTNIRTIRGQLEESKQAMSANRSKGRVLNALMEEKRNGNIPGIFGRLGDLGAIDKKYDVAISTCCSALDNILVDTVDTATACIQYLKDNNIGRAVFIALDKQEHLKQYMPKKTYPENVPRLFDLIRVKDKRVLPAFYFALRDTLVAENLQKATRIAYGSVRYRVVTLDGNVIEVSGTMSGGGKTQIRGKMSSSVQQDTSEQDPRGVKDLEGQLENLEKRLKKVRADLQGREEAISRLQANFTEGTNNLRKLNFELNSLNEHLPALRIQVQAQEKKLRSCKVDPAKTARLEAAKDNGEQQMLTAKENANTIEVQVRAIDAKISAAAGGKVKELQTKIDNIKKEITKVSSEIAKLKVEINTSNRNAKKIKDKITQMETELNDLIERLSRMQVNKRDHANEVEVLSSELKTVEEQLKEAGTGNHNIKKKIAKYTERENKLKCERIEAENEANKMEKVLLALEAKMPSLRQELQKIVLEDAGLDDVPGLQRPDPLKVYTDEELNNCDLKELENLFEVQERRAGDVRPNIQAILDFKTKEQLYIRRVGELELITTERNTLREAYENLKKRRSAEFLTGFAMITTKLKEMYQLITLGGDAELELVDSLDPFTEGVMFSVRPPSKSWKNISNLSGGEKTLSSLALVFALHYYKPSPLYVMDEIDAALDFKNVSIVAHYIKERTKNAQFIIISLRYNMFEAASRLVGIYKVNDCTSSITINNELPNLEVFGLNDRMVSRAKPMNKGRGQLLPPV